jgi:hypothetical protein
MKPFVLVLLALSVLGGITGPSWGAPPDPRDAQQFYDQVDREGSGGQ